MSERSIKLLSGCNQGFGSSRSVNLFKSELSTEQAENYLCTCANFIEIKFV